MNSSIIVDHPALLTAAAVLAGMIIKWLLDLFFLRGRTFALEEEHHRRGQQLDEARTRLNLVQSEAQGKADLLKATQRSRNELEEKLKAITANAIPPSVIVERDQAMAEVQRIHAKLTTAETARLDALRTAEEARREKSELARKVIELTESVGKDRNQAGEAKRRIVELERQISETEDGVRETRLHLQAQLSAHEALSKAVRDRDEKLLAAGESAREAGRAQAEIKTLKSRLETAQQRAAELESASSSSVDRLRQFERQMEESLRARQQLEDVIRKTKADRDEARGQLKEAQALAASRTAETSQARIELQTAREHAAVLEGTLRKLEEAAATQASGRIAEVSELSRLTSELHTLRQRAEAAETRSAENSRRAGEAAAALTEESSRLAQLQRELKIAADQRRELTSELKAVSQANESLSSQLLALRNETNPSTNVLQVSPPPAGDQKALLDDLEALSKERNQLAAELAALKAAQPASRSSRKSNTGPELDLGLPPVPPSEPRARKNPRNRDAESTPTDSPTPEPTPFVAASPQHLSDVKGIGSAFETRLYAAGVGSYWELSRLTDAQFIEHLELDDSAAQQFDFEATRADAARWAEKTDSVGRTWSREPPDDLEPLEGIGKAYEKRLYEAGICTYDELARSTPERLAEICPGSGLRQPDYQHWISQAQALVEQRQNS